MSLDPLQATIAIERRYMDYLETTFSLNDTRLQKELMAELKQPGRFVKGPILEATPPFLTASSLQDLIDEGLFSKEFIELKTDDLPLERELYKHQEWPSVNLLWNVEILSWLQGPGRARQKLFYYRY